MSDHMTPLDIVLSTISGGKPAALAKLLNVHRSTVSGWKNTGRRPRDMSGTVPQKYIPAILAEAERQGKTIAASSLIPCSQPKKSDQ